MDEGHTSQSPCSLVSYHTPACLDRWNCLSFFGPNRHAGQANGPTVAPVSLCVPSLGSVQPTPPPKESRPNLGGFPRPWAVGQWGPRRNPAKRFRWGDEEQWNERVFALLGGNEGYVACDDEKQEKGEGSQAPPLRPQMPAVRAFVQGSNRAL